MNLKIKSRISIDHLHTDEGGWAMVTAVALMAVMLTLGLATMSGVDFASQQTRQQRELESSLHLTEGVLYAQAFALARNWPARDKTETNGTSIFYPDKCTSNGHTGNEFLRCPNKDNLSAANSANKGAAAFAGTDFLANGSWTTRIRDNYDELAATYVPAQANAQLSGTLGVCNTPPAPCSRDFNDDKAMWVESRAVVRGKARRVVALMRLEQVREAVPVVGIKTGAIAITNNGAGSYDVSGASATVSCPPDQSQGNEATCTNYKSANQVKPAPQQTAPTTWMTAAQIERFRDRAIADGTYYTGCAPSLAGAVVFMEYCPAEGSDPGKTYTAGGTPCAPSPQTAPAGMTNDCTNSIIRPGMVIVRCGGIRLQNGTYVGVLYFVNGSDNKTGSGCTNSTGTKRGVGTNPTCPKNAQKDETRVVLDIQAGGGVWGAIAADGGACVQLGSNGLQTKFDPNVFSAVASYGTVGLVQNTWRELPPGNS